MKEQSTILTLDHVTVGYKGRCVVKDITTTLRSGHLTCLVGSNGAGKSTLLKTLCGFQAPLSGSIKLDGEDLKSMSNRSLAEKVGIVLTRRPSAMNMTVEDLVTLGRTPYSSLLGGFKKEDKEIICRSIEQVGIADLSKRRVATLSDGELQKALIAKTLAQQTPVILLDEATAFLDYPAKAEMMSLLSRLAHDDDKIVLQSTHDLDLAFQVADDLWLINDSKIHCGTPEQLAANGDLGRVFASPTLTFSPETLSFRIHSPKI